jgi:chitinase
VSGATFPAPWTGTINVSDSDPDGSVAKIAFFAGTTLLGTITNPAANATFTVTNLAAGNYALTAVATDNGGASTTSAGVTISVMAGSQSITLSSVQRESATSFQFSYGTTPGSNYVVERSNDSLHWNRVVTNTATGASATFTDTAATNAANFYRVMLLP